MPFPAQTALSWIWRHESGTYVKFTETGAHIAAIVTQCTTPEIAEPAGRGTETAAT
jgi:hypothetical protein